MSFEILIFHIVLSACVISNLYSFLQVLNLHITCNELIDVNWNSISLTDSWEIDSPPPLLFVMAETLMPALWIVFHNCYLYLCISSLLITMADFGVLIFGVCFIFACLILELLLINQNKTTSKITQFTVFQLILNCGPRGSNSFFTRILVLRIKYNNITTNGSSEDFFFFSIVAQIKIIELIVQTSSTGTFLY